MKITDTSSPSHIRSTYFVFFHRHIYRLHVELCDYSYQELVFIQTIFHVFKQKQSQEEAHFSQSKEKITKKTLYNVPQILFLIENIFSHGMPKLNFFNIILIIIVSGQTLCFLSSVYLIYSRNKVSICFLIVATYKNKCNYIISSFSGHFQILYQRKVL